LRRGSLEQPNAEGATAWRTTDGRTLYGRRDAKVFHLWCPDVATFTFGRVGPVDYDPVDDGDARLLWQRSALPLAVEARGMPVLHASAVSSGDRCVVVCGRSTAGKSTLAAAAGREGHRVESDDAIGFAMRDGSVMARTLPFEIRLRPSAATELASISFDGAGGRELELRQLVLLEPDADATDVGLNLISAGAAFGSLMPHAYCFSLTDSQERIVREYTELAERVPVRSLRYRPQHASLPAMVDAVGSLLA
jgi:hypothetical protein